MQTNTSNKENLLQSDSRWLMKQQARVIKFVIWTVLAMLCLFVTWSAYSSVAEVTTGSGVIIPSSREQAVQSLDGGVISEITVVEGDTVAKGEIVVRLENAVQQTELEEIEAKYRSNLAKIARLQAEVTGEPLVFPDQLDAYPDITASEASLYEARARNRDGVTAILKESVTSLTEEIALVQRMVDQKAASETQLYQLQRQLFEQEVRLQDIQKEYRVSPEEELVRLRNEIVSQVQVVRNRRLAFERTFIRSPVDGVVKNVHISTVGGVVPPNGRILEIVPLHDPLVVEARISPRDIAFIHPGQEAMVKITAYDYSVYGGLSGAVKTISPDSMKEEGSDDGYYYRVLVETEEGGMPGNVGDPLPISPGMVASVEIQTGSKTVLQYLMTPISRAGEALRER